MATEQGKEWTGKSRGGGIGHAVFIFLIRHCGIRSAYLLLAFVACYFIPFAPGLPPLYGITIVVAITADYALQQPSTITITDLDRRSSIASLSEPV